MWNVFLIIFLPIIAGIRRFLSVQFYYSLNGQTIKINYNHKNMYIYRVLAINNKYNFVLAFIEEKNISVCFYNYEYVCSTNIDDLNFKHFLLFIFYNIKGKELIIKSSLFLRFRILKGILHADKCKSASFSKPCSSSRTEVNGGVWFYGLTTIKLRFSCKTTGVNSFNIN